MCFQHKEHIYYKQMFDPDKENFSVVEVLLWINDNVLIEDVKTGLKYVLTGDEFLQFHKMLTYECDVNEYIGSDLGRLLNGSE